MESKKITISDLLNNRISPFDINDTKLMELFSFFLHSAPTINSKTAIIIEDNIIEKKWEKFIEEYNNNFYIFLSPNCRIQDYFNKYHLNSTTEINRKTKGFICKKKNKEENDIKCLLRHLRNAIAHSNVFMLNIGNRKYILLEDFNTSGNQSSRILFSQNDLKKLKDIIMH